MWMRSSVVALAAVLGWTGSAIGSAQAQTPPQASGDDATSNPEIIVTVQKREQAIIDVPMAITSYDGDFLDRVGVTKFDDLALWVPGLEVQEQSPNNPAVSMRGITTDSGEAFVEPRVAIFQDGVSISKSRGSYVELFDIERVEVAKGPQATLFGRGAMIGGLNIIQNKPRLDALGVEGVLRGGDTGQFGATAVVNAPLIEDQLGVRFAATHRERDGFVRNVLGGPDLGGVDLDAFRASVLWEPTSSVSTTLIFNTQTDDNAGTSFKSQAFAPTPGASTSPFTAAALNRSSPGFERDRQIGLDRRVDSVSFTTDWAIDDSFTFSAITGYRFFKSFEMFDPDGSQNPILLSVEDAKGRQWSQELRLNFDDGGQVSWFIGGAWTEESGRQRIPTVWDERFTLGLITGALARPDPQSGFTNGLLIAALQGLGVPAAAAAVIAPRLKAQQYEVYTNTASTTSADIYGDLTWAFAPQFEVSAGLRWTEDRKSSGVSASLINGNSILGTALALGSLSPAQQTATLQAIALTGSSPIPVGLFTQPTAPGGVSRSGRFDDLTWRLVGRWMPNDDMSAWLSFARGRRPDVISAVPGQAPGSTARTNLVSAETVDSVELGVRGQAFDGALRYDASIYNYAYSNFQTVEFQGLQIVPINAGDASATGFEGSLFWRVNDAVELFGNVGLNRARFDNGARRGNTFRLSPDQTVALGGTFTADFGAAGAIAVTPSYTWQSKVFFDDDNDRADLQRPFSPALADTRVDEVQDAYGLLNLRLVYTPAQGGWEVGAYVTNALDEEFVIDAGNTGDGLGLPTFIRGAPRLAGVEVKAKF